MDQKICGVEHRGLDLPLIGTEQDLPKIHQAICESLISLVTGDPCSYVDVYLSDGEEVTSYRIVLEKVVRSDKEFALTMIKQSETSVPLALFKERYFSVIK